MKNTPVTINGLTVTTPEEKHRLLICYLEEAKMWKDKNNLTNYLDCLKTATYLAELLDDNEMQCFLIGKQLLQLSDMENFPAILESSTHLMNLALKYRLDKYQSVATTYLGYYYSNVGNNELCLKYYYEGLEIAKRINDIEGIRAKLNNIGLKLIELGKYHEGLKYLLESVETSSTEDFSKKDLSRTYNNIGRAYLELKNKLKALEYLTLAHSLSEEIGDVKDQIIRLINISQIYIEESNHSEALRHLEKALALSKKVNYSKESKILLYHSLGLCYYSNGDLKKSINFYFRCIEIIEELRNSFDSKDKMSYFNSAHSTYELLSLALLVDGQGEKSLQIIETSSAKFLKEKLNNLSEHFIEKTVANYLMYLKKDTCIIRFSLFNQKESIVYYAEQNGERYDLNFNIVKINQIGKELLKEYHEEISQVIQFDDNLVIDKYGNVILCEEFFYINKFINTAITDYKDDLKISNILYKILKELYNAYFGPFTEQIKNKKKIVIIPDSYLYQFPFEALINAAGQFLVEDYEISYAFSLGTWHYFENKMNPNEFSHNIIAFGAPIYDFDTYENSLKEYEEILKNIVHNINIRKQLSEKYINLPGTLLEVKLIKEKIERADIYTGKDVTKENIISLSREGKLKNYRIIHFAVHGHLSNDSLSESALVFCSNDEDFLLRASEVSDLKINCELITLSACNTGRGKLFNGEGLFGFTHEFLSKGSDSVAVSLWEISDEATALFMISVYTNIFSHGMLPVEAFNRVKKDFINSNEHSHPYYWAPFVLYGRTLK